jgi:phosphoribosyl-ATP pyrophosphohydrolase
MPSNAAADRLSDLTQFGLNPGNLRARVYIPTGLPAGAPLVVVLHGCTQTAAGYDHGSGWSSVADRYGFAVLYPEQQRANNPNLCFNWFRPGDCRRDAGEPLSIRPGELRDFFARFLRQTPHAAILEKVAEESAETLLASKDGDKLHIVRETADLWFHCLVLLAWHGLTSDDVLSELRRREGISGVDEKASRKK